ncbi:MULTISPECIES: flavin reductase family protein [Streptosporangiaceae]|uniref:Flavin reductase (DIM6/NTAB) family NADH-FMN oxidoreductase RutF n=1 Tax=Planomonospora venezuelensis TaxID=1999 RepID=A0A841D770_PLAVE|nr:MULTISPECIES: flavin reductase family protein [Streptosporangiaceae]MBB5966462.1 flavin reductase (DIM6/NTAB) family NADH-FMN oxidoreductase RutF [Planomonospora venezuelensis]GIN04119.1 putative oxidoreductase [Planomonospora venezuelensis]
MTHNNAEVPLDGRLLRTAFGKFPTGVVAVCAMHGTEPVGMAVSAFMPVSLDPPLLSVCIQLSSTTWPRLREAGVVGVSVLSRAQQAHAQRLASKEADRFAGLEVTRLPSGAVVVGGTHAWFECAIRESHQAGDHEIVVLEILRLQVESHADDPMVFFASGFRGLRHVQGVSADSLAGLEAAHW